MNVLVFLGSRRASSPPNPPRLGERIARHLVLEASSVFAVDLVDPAGPGFEIALPRQLDGIFDALL